MLSIMRRGLAVAAVLLPALAAGPAAATVTAALDVRELVAQADHVVVGRVVSQHAHWDARRRIVTDVTVEVEQSMKGAAEGERIVVRRLGGAIGDLGMRVAGEPDFTDGERAVLFAARSGGLLRPVGMSQGVLPIRVDPRGREMVLPGGQGLALVRPVQGNRLVTAPAALIGPRPLEDVLDDIRRAVEEARAR